MPIIRNNQTEFTFNNIYYVDSLNGSDSNNGSNNSPFLTVSHAISKCSLKGDAIFAKAGTYDVTRIAGDFDSGGLWDGNKEIYFLGKKKKPSFYVMAQNIVAETHIALCFKIQKQKHTILLLTLK